MTEQIGRVLGGKYRIVRLLGAGGMGEVYQAEHVKLKRMVAVKLMRAELSSVPEAMERFVREAQAASAIGHPNIIDIQDIGEEPDGSIFLVMELLQGEPLDYLIAKSGGKIPAQRALGIILQVLSALVATHKKNITHRDLKPENIFLAADGLNREVVKLLDFGASKFMEKDQDSMRLTQTGVVIGTPVYLAPEQARGSKDVDHRVDIWAAGAVFYEMVAGRPPFAGDSYNELLGNILLEPIVPLRELVPELSKGLAAAVEKALQKSPDERYPSSAKMLETLLPFYNGDPGRDMSTAAIQMIHNSVAPPPVRVNQDETETLDAAPALLAEARQTTRPTGKHRSVTLIGISVAVAVITLALGVFVATRGDDKPTVVQLSPVAKTASSPSTSVPTTTPTQPPTPAVALPAEIKIEVSGLVPGAVVTLDGKPVSTPVTVPKSDREITLEVRAEGYAPFTATVRTDQDSTVQASLQKLVTPEPTTPTKKRKHGGKKSGSPNELFAENPFE